MNVMCSEFKMTRDFRHCGLVRVEKMANGRLTKHCGRIANKASLGQRAELHHCHDSLVSTVLVDLISLVKISFKHSTVFNFKRTNIIPSLQASPLIGLDLLDVMSIVIVVHSAHWGRVDTDIR
jgi:hypothetical protein